MSKTNWISAAKTLMSLYNDARTAFWRGYIRGLRDAEGGNKNEALLKTKKRTEPDSFRREEARGYRLGLDLVPFEQAREFEALVLPACVDFASHTFSFEQPDPPFGHDLKILIRNKARNLTPYRFPVLVVPEVMGYDDKRNPIPINTLGKWLFGVPGFKGHLRVIPMKEKIEVHLFLPEGEEKVEAVVLDLLEAVFRKMGLAR